LNFVQKVVPAGQELTEALRIAELIAQQAPQAVVATRQNVLKAIEHGPVAAMLDFIEVQKRLTNTEDAAEGLRSFVERRPAQFTGR
jgi:enoyl-CoA hydratase/carnithine racemase